MSLAKDMANKLPDGITLTFSGDLGAGKTTFVRGLAEGRRSHSQGNAQRTSAHH